ncbi:MAG: hypothetical protein VB054_03200 [Petrimonas sp.]|nr:hypothetical protein [Petrimonas sp.]
MHKVSARGDTQDHASGVDDLVSITGGRSPCHCRLPGVNVALVLWLVRGENDRNETGGFPLLHLLLAQFPLPIEKLRGRNALVPAKIFYLQSAGLVAGINLFKLLLVPHRFFACKNRIT